METALIPQEIIATKLCDCGCGHPVAKPTNRFVLGHNVQRKRFATSGIRVCSKCGLPKDIETEFYPGRHGWSRCKACIQAKSAAYRLTAKGQLVRKSSAQRRREDPIRRARDNEHKYKSNQRPERIAALAVRYHRFRAFLAGYKSFMCCIDCGEENPDTLHFDHVRGVKKFKVTINSHFSFPTILSEIEKCDIRCNKCHKARHQRESNRAAHTRFHIQRGIISAACEWCQTDSLPWTPKPLETAVA